MMRGKKTVKNSAKLHKSIKNCQKMQKKNCQKMQKIARLEKKCQKKIAILLKIAKKRGRDFPEGQVPT